MSDALLIVNASPLIVLANAGHLELLHSLGASRIIVPEPVFDEVISGGYTDQAARMISDATWIEKRPSPPIPESVVAWEIGKGESSVIATALHEPGARVVIDELNGRKCALAHELDVVHQVCAISCQLPRLESPQRFAIIRIAGPRGDRVWPPSGQGASTLPRKQPPAAPQRTRA